MNVSILEMRKALCAYQEVWYDGTSKKEIINALEYIKECCDNLKTSVDEALEILETKI